MEPGSMVSFLLIASVLLHDNDKTGVSRADGRQDKRERLGPLRYSEGGTRDGTLWRGDLDQAKEFSGGESCHQMARPAPPKAEISFYTPDSENPGHSVLPGQGRRFEKPASRGNISRGRFFPPAK